MSTDQVDDDDTASRRQWLRASAKTLAPGVGGLVAFSALTTASHPENTPDHVHEPVFDEALLERYKPQLMTFDVDVEPSSIVGSVIRSDSKDTTALTYWSEYPVQLDATGFASHIGDREPFYVFIENEGTTSERISSVAYSGYHWMISRSGDPPTVDGDDDSRPLAYVFTDYHHYGLDVARNVGRPGTEYPLRDLSNRLPRWLADDDFHEALSGDWEDRGSIAYNPWIALDKASFWRKQGFWSFEERLRALWLWLGLYDADRTDFNS